MHLFGTFATATMCALAVCSGVSAQVVSIATNPQGSIAYSTGAAVAKLLNEQGGITARVFPLAGSTTYIPMVNKNEIEFGFVNAVESVFAYNASGTFESEPPNPNIRLIGVLYPIYTSFAVPNDVGVKTIADVRDKLKGKRLPSEYTSLSIIELYIKGALANGGMTYDEFTKVPVSNHSEGMDTLAQGKADITWMTLGTANAQKTETALRNRGGFRFVDLDGSAEGVARLNEHLPGAQIIEVEPKRGWPGIKEPTHIVQIGYLMFTNASASEDLVYEVTKLIAENKEELANSLSAFGRMDPPNMAPEHPVPYHPGAIKYYKEAGISTN